MSADRDAATWQRDGRAAPVPLGSWSVEYSDADDLTCQELVELATEYLEGALPPAPRARFEAHLALCRKCRNYLGQMQETIRLVGKLTEETIQPRARRELLAAFRDWKRDGQVRLT